MKFAAPNAASSSKQTILRYSDATNTDLVLRIAYPQPAISRIRSLLQMDLLARSGAFWPTRQDNIAFKIVEFPNI